MRTIVLLCLASAVSTAHAAPDWPLVQARAQAFAQARVEDSRQLLLGPAPTPVTPPPATLNCAELYAERLALMRTQVDYRPAYTDDPRNQAAAFIGSIFTPGFYFLPFSAIQAYTDSKRGPHTERQLDELRYASASQQCYVR